MNIIKKIRWLRLKIKFGKKLKMPIQTYLGQIKIQISGNGSVSIQKGFSTRDNVVIHASGGEIEIGMNTFISDGCMLNSRKKITIGNRTILGQNILMYDHDHSYRSGPEHLRSKFEESPIKVGDDVWIGSGVIILKGATIGNRCVIGAGTIVKGNIPDDTLIYEIRKHKMENLLKFGGNNAKFYT